MSEENKQPSFVRVDRVNTILSDEPAFKDKISKKRDVTLLKRDGSKHLFSAEVVNVAKAMQEANIDAATCAKSEILRHAAAVLGLPNEEMPATPAAEPDGDGPLPAETKNVTLEFPEANPCMCVVNLLLGAMQLSAFDKNPGNDKRRAALEQIEKEYARFL